MKQISICLMMAVMCLSSCKPEKIIGGCTYEGVYIETVTGLVNAHSYQMSSTSILTVSGLLPIIALKRGHCPYTLQMKSE